MVVLAVIAAVLAALLLIPLGVSGEAGTEGMSLSAHIGPVKLRILPLKKKSGAELPEKAGSSGTEPRKKKGLPKFIGELTPERIFAYIGVASRAFGRLRRKLRIDSFRLWYQASSDDPSRAAMTYGAACAAVETAMAALRTAFDVRDSDVRVGVDFTGGGQRVLAGGRLTIRIWQLLYIGAASAVDFIKTEKRLRDNKKHDSERNDSNGKPGRRYDGKDHVEDKGNGGRQHDSGNAYNNA